jgi:hypothetical protein
MICLFDCGAGHTDVAQNHIWIVPLHGFRSLGGTGSSGDGGFAFGKDAMNQNRRVVLVMDDQNMEPEKIRAWNRRSCGGSGRKGPSLAFQFRLKENDFIGQNEVSTENPVINYL